MFPDEMSFDEPSAAILRHEPSLPCLKTDNTFDRARQLGLAMVSFSKPQAAGRVERRRRMQRMGDSARRKLVPETVKRSVVCM